MAALFRCTGRVFPNGPANSRVGCTRRSPRVFQVRFQSAIWHQYQQYENVWLNVYWSGNDTFGRDPRCNWNLDEFEFPGADVNLQISSANPPLPRFQSIVTYQFFDGASKDQLYTPGFFDFITWEDYLVTQQWPCTQDPVDRLVLNDDFIDVRIGKYADLPADICIL